MSRRVDGVRIVYYVNSSDTEYVSDILDDCVRSGGNLRQSVGIGPQTFDVDNFLFLLEYSTHTRFGDTFVSSLCVRRRHTPKRRSHFTDPRLHKAPSVQPYRG